MTHYWDDEINTPLDGYPFADQREKVLREELERIENETKNYRRGSGYWSIGARASFALDRAYGKDRL